MTDRPNLRAGKTGRASRSEQSITDLAMAIRSLEQVRDALRTKSEPSCDDVELVQLAKRHVDEVLERYSGRRAPRR